MGSAAVKVFFCCVIARTFGLDLPCVGIRRVRAVNVSVEEYGYEWSVGLFLGGRGVMVCIRQNMFVGILQVPAPYLRNKDLHYVSNRIMILTTE